MRPLLLALLIALAPATADAATVSVQLSGGGGGKYDSVSAHAYFVAGPGEVNDLLIAEAAGTVRFSDVVPVQPGERCRAVDATTVECDASSGDADLGDGPDRMRCSQYCGVRGGEGDDWLEALPGAVLNAHGGDGSDVLRGSGGIDRLSGGRGTDVLEGGGGGDDLAGDDVTPPYAADRIDGGDGDEDLVSYAGRATPVRVALGAPGSGGAPEEGDVISGIERVHGGVAPDVLIGDDGPNELSGAGIPPTGRAGDRLIGAGGDDHLNGSDGRDVLDGGAGNDFLVGHAGPDRYIGGDGDDRFLVTHYPFMRRHAQTALACGAGDDRVIGPNLRDRLSRACERIETGAMLLTRLPGGLRFRARHDPEVRLSCPMRMVVTAGRRVRERSFTLKGTRTLTFPGFTTASIALYVRPCWLGRGRRERLHGGFRST